MRVMVKFVLPVESSNTAIRTGKLEKSCIRSSKT